MPCPCKSTRHQQQPNPSSLLSFSHFLCRSVPSVLWFLIPKGVSGSADTTGIQPCQLPLSNTRSSSTPPLHVHMQRKEASQLWQQQNTTLQKRCAPLTVTIKKGVDRIRAGDDDLRGRNVQKEARREEKGLSFLCFHFFIPFFIFSGIIKPHLTHV